MWQMTDAWNGRGDECIFVKSKLYSIRLDIYVRVRPHGTYVILMLLSHLKSGWSSAVAVSPCERWPMRASHDTCSRKTSLPLITWLLRFDLRKLYNRDGPWRWRPLKIRSVFGSYNYLNLTLGREDDQFPLTWLRSLYFQKDSEMPEWMQMLTFQR